MVYFAAALAGFVLLHVGISATGLRAVLVRTMGEWPYRGLFSVLSAGFLAAIVVTFAMARTEAADLGLSPLYAPPAWAFHATHAINLLAFIFIVGGLLSAGPTMVGFEGGLRKDDPAKGFARITRHPFLWGVALWGAGHLLVNGERYAVMLFGALAVMVMLGARSIDRKMRVRDPEGWAAYAQVTSNIPFAAIASGRNSLRIGEIWWRTVLAVVAYFAVAYVHNPLFGVRVFSFGL